MGIAGVRGAITLAAVLSLPADNGGAAGFPDREFLVVAAAGVIILSLILANATLPALLARLGNKELDPSAGEADRARAALARCAVHELEQQRIELTRTLNEQGSDAKRDEDSAHRLEAVTRLLSEYTDRLYRFDDATEDQPNLTAKEVAWKRERSEAAIRLHIMRTERQELRRMLRARRINDETERLLQREIDLAEQALLEMARLLPRQKPAE
jgi:NhaP-type Na+/H+ or K+/H+ antiporter